MNTSILVRLATLSACAVLSASAQDWNSDWKFHQGDAAPDAQTREWQGVSIPHTWNATDASDGGSDSGKAKDAYYRGPGWYAKSFRTPEEWSSKRVFLRFQGVSSVADVYLNGTRLGQHRGGFNAFCFEVTPYLAKSGKKNDLRVRADNTPFDDVPPLSGDFPVFGGFYRPMEVLVKPQTCITPLDFASPGIYISQNKVTKDAAEISVLTKVIRAGASALPVEVACRILDGDKEVAKGVSSSVPLKPGEEAALDVPLTINAPHLWNGRKDPHLYSVEVTLKEDGKAVEQSIQPLGLRFYRADPKSGFFLNGEPYRLYGVNRHQDREGKGWAISREDIEEDHRLIMEIGARAVRFSHYPHPALAYSLCDRDGLLAWAEIPIVSKISDSPEFAAAARQQLVEMIRQNFNHPSIFTWGIFNELYMAKGPDATALVQDLNTLAKKEDPTRPTTAGTQKFFPETCTVTDLLGFNDYPGWYWGKPEDMVWKLNDFIRYSGSRGACASEYGAGASIHHHEFPAKMPKSGGPWHPEEWQAIVHETTWDAIRSNPAVWGSFVWNMFDFASDWRNEGDRPGINDKGLVTRDRKTPKDAFYFYKANWSPEPVIHITSKRFTDRKDAVTDVKIYTNSPEAELILNGKSLGKMTPDDLHRAAWKDVTLTPGKNTLEARATAPNGNPLTDACTWTLDPAR